MNEQGVWIVVGECTQCGAEWTREEAIRAGIRIAGTVSVAEASASGSGFRCSECGARFGGDRS